MADLYFAIKIFKEFKVIFNIIGYFLIVVVCVITCKLYVKHNERKSKKDNAN